SVLQDSTPRIRLAIPLVWSLEKLAELLKTPKDPLGMGYSGDHCVPSHLISPLPYPRDSTVKVTFTSLTELPAESAACTEYGNSYCVSFRAVIRCCPPPVPRVRITVFPPTVSAVLPVMAAP